MYAVIRQGGRQYRVEPNEVIQVDKLEAENGAEFVIDNVLALRSDNGLEIGEPVVAGAAVRAKVVRHDRGPKIVIFKMRRRKGFARKHGHRQQFTEIKILAISKNGKDLA